MRPPALFVLGSTFSSTPRRTLTVVAFATLAVAASVAFVGCGGAPAPAAAPSAAVPQKSGAERFMPLERGTIWSFRTSSQRLNSGGLAVMEVTARSGDDVTLAIAGKAHQYRVTEHAIADADGEGALLAGPFEKGATFHGQEGTVTISAVGVHIDVPAGSYDDCLETTETSGQGKESRKLVTHYCPGVGLVARTVEGWDGEAHDVFRYELTYYGPKLTF